MDTVSKTIRSWNMSRIRSRDTGPERMVRSILHRAGFRFRKSTGRRLFGSPDIVLPKYRVVVFVHGCFWHRHKGCRLAYEPKSRTAFWKAKFAANTTRDAKVSRQLKRCGWRVIVVWECELDNPDCVTRRVFRVIGRGRCWCGGVIQASMRPGGFGQIRECGYVSGVSS